MRDYYLYIFFLITFLLRFFDINFSRFFFCFLIIYVVTNVRLWFPQVWRFVAIYDQYNQIIKIGIQLWFLNQTRRAFIADLVNGLVRFENIARRFRVGFVRNVRAHESDVIILILQWWLWKFRPLESISQGHPRNILF